MAAPDEEDHEVRAVQPYEAVKAYLCPGCHQEIRPGTGHLVVIPRAAPDLRRHWHRGCWNARGRRRPGPDRPARRPRH